MSLSPEDEKIVRARQKSRALVMGLMLGFLVILFYAITIVKIGTGH